MRHELGCDSAPHFRHLSAHAAVGRTVIVRPGRPHYSLDNKNMGDPIMLGFLMWLVLLFLCWPLALLALVLYPLIWLILLPFRLLGIGVDAVFELLRAIVMLPARVLGGRR
jgi:hypothetical protein